MVKTWIQFSVWDEKWPHRAITDFLPQLETIIPVGTRWHFLYEPNLLVRIETEDFEILNQAGRLARNLDYQFIPADSSKGNYILDFHKKRKEIKTDESCRIDR